MSDLTREIAARRPTPEEIDQILARAREMRARAARNAMVGIWAMLQRAMTRKDASRAPRHV